MSEEASLDTDEQSSLIQSVTATPTIPRTYGNGATFTLREESHDDVFVLGDGAEAVRDLDDSGIGLDSGEQSQEPDLEGSRADPSLPGQ